MYVTKDGRTRLINDATLPYWRSQGWEVDDTPEVGDDAAASLPTPSPAGAGKVPVVNDAGTGYELVEPLTPG